MANNPYEDIDKEMVDKLSFEHSACNYVYYSDKDGFQKGMLYEIDKMTYNGILNILKGDDSMKLKKGDKVYILPGHPLSQVRVKEYFKRIGVTMTNDISKATAIAGGNAFYESLSTYDNNKHQSKLNTLMFNANEISYIHKFEEVDNDLDGLAKYLGHKVIEDLENDIKCIVSKYAAYKTDWHNNLCYLSDKCYITPSGMKILYHVLDNKIKVITAENICDEANSGLKMEDADTYRSIYQMLDSTDDANIRLGINILTHCDLSGDSLLNIYKLARNFKYLTSTYRYTKNMHYFSNRTDWNKLAYFSPEELIVYAKENDKLTESILKELLPEIYNNKLDYINSQKSDFFDIIETDDMAVTIKIKNEWKELTKEKEQV